MSFFMDILGIATPALVDETDGKYAVWSRPGREIRILTEPAVSTHFRLTVDDTVEELPTRELTTHLRLHFPVQPQVGSQVAALAFWEGVRHAARYVADGHPANRQQARAFLEAGFRALADKAPKDKEPLQ